MDAAEEPPWLVAGDSEGGDNGIMTKIGGTAPHVTEVRRATAFRTAAPGHRRRDAPVGDDGPEGNLFCVVDAGYPDGPRHPDGPGARRARGSVDDDTSIR